eukprot:3787462-Pleurochrysis_carterae.AAC.1
MNIRPVYNEDGTTGKKCTKYFRGGGKGYGTNMMHRRREKRMGREEKREWTYGIKHWGRVRTIPKIHIQ